MVVKLDSIWIRMVGTFWFIGGSALGISFVGTVAGVAVLAGSIGAMAMRL